MYQARPFGLLENPNARSFACMQQFGGSSESGGSFVQSVCDCLQFTFKAMVGENRQSVTDGPVEFEKLPIILEEFTEHYPI